MKPIERSDHFFTSQESLLGFVMIVNFFSWFFPLYILYDSTLRNLLTDYSLFEYIMGVLYVSALASAIIGVSLVKKTKNRGKVLYLWMASGIIASLLFGFVPVAKNLSYLFFFSFVLGTSLGFGFPSILAYFADHNDNNRGRRAGFTFFVSGLGIVLAGLATVLLPFVVNVLIFAAWRAAGCVVFLLLCPKEKEEVRTDVTFRSILEQKAFLLYFVPWIMYCIINYSEASLLKAFFGQEFSYFVPVAEYAMGGAIAFVGGYISDLIGRKIVIIFGYATLGIGYALLGLFPYNTISWYSYVVVDSISVGIFALSFFILIWGELAADKPKEKYFLLGAMPYLVLSYLGIALQPYIEFIPVSSAFSLAALFLFLAILPLMYAPETLPEKKLKERELKGYLEKAKKIKEKYA